MKKEKPLKMYTPQEVADIIKINRRNVYRYMKDGKLKAAKLGGVWRISEENLQEFITPKER